MKKFMIFLLMAFLYLGTCQARSEATHFDNANVKLHSWVLPSTSQSFSMDVNAIYANPIVKVTPSQPQNLCLSCPRNTALFGLSFDENGSGESVASRVWMVNDHNTDSTGTTFTFGGYAAGHYTVACKVTTDAGNTYTSNYVDVTIDADDFVINIVGPDHACQNDVVSLVAQVEGSVLDIAYQWRRDGQYIIGATEPRYDFLVDTLPGLTDTLAFEFDVQITRAGCDSKYSPVHYFTVSPTPVTMVDVPLFCNNEPVTLTANSYTSGSEQPYMWKWIKDGSNDTTITYVNYVTIDNAASGDKYKVIPIYQDFACNADTAEVTLKSYQDSLKITAALPALTVNGPDTVCLDGMVRLTVTDPSKGKTELGTPTYAWYMNGVLMDGLTDTICTTVLPTTGDYYFNVIASYSNYPCEHPMGKDTVVVDTVPAAVVITGPNVLCQNQDGTYNDTVIVALVTPAGPGYEYMWTGQTTFKTDSSLRISAPGVYSVTVKTPGGCESVATFEVLGFGADVQLTSTVVACAGEPVVLNANADGWTGSVSYLWSTGAISSSIQVLATVDTAKYWVRSTVNMGGTESCTRTDTIKVAAVGAPSVAPIVTRVSNDSICQGELAIFRISNASSITGVHHYVWYQDGIEIPGYNLDTIAVALDVPGVHTFKAMAVNAAGCSTAFGKGDTIKVKAAPTLVNITGDPVVCENDSTVLKVHAVGDNLTYLWSTGSTKDSIKVPAGVYTVTVSSMQTGCSATAEFTVNTIGSEIQLTATPSQNVCAGESVTLNVHASGWTSGNISYEWFDITDGQNSNQVTFVPTHDGYYKVKTTVVSTSGTCERVDSIYINVDTVKIDEVAYIGGDTLCLGAQATMYVKSTGADHYIWYENGYAVPGQYLDTLRVQPNAPGSYTYSVAAISSNGCTSKDTTIKPDLYILPNPTVEITGDPILCNDSTVRLVALLNDTTNTTANGADGEYTYLWRLYNQNLNSTNTVTDTAITVDGIEHEFTVNYDTLTTTLTSQDHPYIFTVSVVNANGCVAESAPYNVYVGKDLFVDVTVDLDTVCEGGRVTATAHLGDYNLENLTYQWYEINKITSDTDTVANATEISYTTNVDTSTVFMVKITQTTTGCTITGKDSVYVLPVKMLKIVATNETPLANETDSLFVCKGEGIYLTAYVTNEETGETYIDSSFSYVWFENGRLMEGYTRPTFNKQVDIIDDDTLSYQYSAYIDFGIEGCEPQLVYSNVVFVKRNPIVTIRGNQNVCYFGTFEETGVYNVHLIAWVDGGYDTSLTYTWYEHGQVREGVGGSIYDNHYRENWIPTYDNPYSFTVMVSNSDGCVTISEPFEVNVYNKPAVNITATETTICEGGKTELTAHIDNYNEPMLTYQWFTNSTDPDNAIPGMTEPSEIFWPVDTTTYIVKVTHLLENGLPDRQACFNTASYVINVNDIPVIDSVTNDLADANDTICEGRYVTLTAHMHGGVPGGEVYTWYRNGAIIPDAHDSVYVETPAAENGDITTYHYAVSVKQTADGCESDTTNAAIVTVLPNPVLTLVTDPIVCDTLDQNIMMYANVNPIPTSPYHFVWFEDNSVDTLAASADVTFSGEHNDTVKIKREFRDYPYSFAVQMVNEYGCTVRDDALIYVNDNPVVHAISSEYYICQDSITGIITLTANLDDYNADMLEFHWYDVFNGDTTDMVAATSLSYTFAPDSIGEHTYFMTAVQRNSWCEAKSNDVVVMVDSIPVIDSVTNDLAAANDTICEGRYVTLTAHMHGGVHGGEVYTWYRNGAVIPDAHDSVYVETPAAENGDITTYHYAVSVKQTAAGCESDTAQAAVVTVFPNPVLTLVTDPIVCDTLDLNIMMYANVNPIPTSPYHFTWFEDNSVDTLAAAADVIYSGEHQDTIKIKRAYRDYPYSFAVQMVNEYGCTTRDDALIYVNDNPIVHAISTEYNICDGGEITLTANLDDYNADMLEFHWYDVFNGDTTDMVAATDMTYTFVPDSIGTHDYFMTALQRTSLCIAQSNNVTVKVDSIPVIDSVTNDLAAANDTICEGRFVTLTAHMHGGVHGGEVYTWYRNGAVIPEAHDSVYVETPQAINGDPTTYHYAVSVKQTAAGCESDTTNAAIITVLPNPVLKLVTDPIVCDTLDQNIMMYANVNPIPTSPYHFVWFEDNSVDTLAAAADVTFSGEHNDTVRIKRDYRDYPYSFAVEMVNEYGCTTRDDALIYVNDNPVLHAISTEYDICEGGEITLTANLDDYNADMLEFHWYDVWNGDTTDMVAATETSFTFVPDSLGEHNYFMTAFQRTSLCIAQTNNVVVTVNEIPVIDSVTNDLADANDTICDGRFVTLTAHMHGGVQGGEVYTWYRNGAVIPEAHDSIYVETPQAINGDPTTYNYAVSVKQTAAGCESDTAHAATVTVLPNPVIRLVTDPIVCDTNDLNITMYANVTPIPTSPYHFTWFEDNSVDTLAAAADVVYSGDHQDTVKIKRGYRDYAYSFSVQMINDYGCTVRDNANVLVNDNPVVHAITSDSIICIGGEITLTANLDDYNADMLEFHWYDIFEGDTTDMVAATNMSYTFVPRPVGEHKYFMTALQRNSLCIAQSNDVEVLVKVDPVIRQVVLSDYIACEGAQVRIEAIADSTTYTPSATDVYTWYRNGIRIIGATNRVLYDTPTTVDQNTQQFVYTAVVTLEEPGCTSLPVDASALTIYRNPVVAITGDQHVCETDYTFLIANVDTVGMNIGNLHYTWFINGDIRDNAAYNLYDNRFFAEYLYPRDEPYIITVNVERGDIANACSSTSAPFEVYVYEKPDVNVTAVDDITDICENGEVTLQANLGDWNAEHITFQWYEVRTSVDSIAVDYLPGGGYVYDVVTTNYNYYIPGATGFRYTTTLAETTTIGVKVVQTNSQCYDISEYTVTVHPTPAAPVITVDNPMICSDGNARLTVTNDYSEYGTPIFGWESEGVVIPGAFDAYYDHMPGHIAGNTYNYNAIVSFAMPGCISAVSDTASVVVIPDPVVTVTAEGPTEICEGGSVTFTANPQPTTLDYNYQWYGEHNQLMNGDTNATLTVSPAAHQQGYQYVVVVNSLPGCQVVVNAPVVTVHTDPRVTLSIDNSKICQGGVSTLSVYVEGGISDQNGIDPYQYAWYSNNNTETPFAVTSTDFYVLPDTLPVDSFAYWVEVSANAYGCATTSTHVNQWVVADPVVNIIVAPTHPDTVCNGGQTLLFATVDGGVGGADFATYQWSRNGTPWVGETDPTLHTGILSINDLNSYTVTVAQAAPGCMTESDTFRVPVIETYDVQISPINSSTVCSGGTTTLEASITNDILSNDNPTYQWYEIIDGADVLISGATSARYTTSPLLTPGNHTYFVAINSQITEAGCSSRSGSRYTTIVNDPTVTVTTSALGNVVCEGDVVRVNATVSGDEYTTGLDYTYNWTWTNGTNSYTYSNNEPTIAPADLPASINGYLFNVSIVATEANSGCSAASNNNTYVTVMSKPVVTISANNTVVCSGGDVELTANHNASDYSGFNYEWFINGTRIPSTLQTITVPASMVNEGSITAIVNVTSSQLTMSCPSSDTVNQIVQVLAQPTITLNSDHLMMCEGARPTLTATVAGNSNIPMTYTWNFGGQALIGVTGNVYQSAPLAAGVYTVNVEAQSLDAALNCQTGSASIPVVLTVAETPVIGLTSADGLALCEGGSITLTATVINANDPIGGYTNGSIYGAYNYVWTMNDNPALPQPHNNIALPQDQITQTLNTVGVYNYNVYVTPVGPMAFGCGVASPAEPLQVVVNARPNWDAVAVNPANGNICLGEEVQLHAHITGGVVDMNGNTNGHIQWVVEYNGVASNVSNYGGDAAHTPTEPGLYTYYPTYIPYEGTILGSGCSFTNSDQVLSYVTVHELPTAEFVSGNGTILCANVSDDNAALTIHFTGTAPFTFQVLDLTSGVTTMYTSYTNDYTIYVSPDHTTQYSITTLSDEYCNSGELGLGAIATIFVNDIRFTNTFFVADCDADEVTIDFTMVSGTANSDFTVTYDNGLVVNGTISNNTATFPTPNVPGDYNAVFSVGGCDYDIIVRRPVHIDDFSDGTVPFMMQRWDDVAIINNNPATNGGHTFVSYQWYRNGELIPGAIYKNYQEIGGLNGFYSIEVVSKDADGRTVTYHTCEQYFSSNNSVKVYPVPATVQQVVTVEFDMTAEELEGATLDIYDVTGSIINHIATVEPITKVAGFKAAGTYFGRITSANGETKTVKFVIVK